MIYVVAIIAGIAGAVVGWFVTSVITLWIAGWYGMSDFEGGRGMFAFLGVGPIGGLISMIAAAWLVLRFGAGRVPVGHTIVRLAVVLGTIAVLVGAGVWIRLQTLDTYTDSAPPTLEFEIRVPTTMAIPPPAALRVELHTDKNVGESQLTTDWSTENGGAVIAGSVPLDFKTSSRLLVVSWPDQPVRLFRLSLSRDPPSTAPLGAWHRPDHIDEAGASPPPPAPADDPVEIRYRVRRAGED